MKAKNFIVIVFLFTCINCENNASNAAQNSNPKAGVRILRKDLNYPWEITLAKDNSIWMTEREGKISRIDPSSGKTLFSFTIKEVQSRNEGGLLGPAFDPDFEHNGFLYVVYDYNKNGSYTEKLVRFTYAKNTLSSPFVLIDNITANTNHNGSRLWITNEAKPKIFMSTGDAFNDDLAQPTNTLNGKILRLNLDGTIPADNPFQNNPVWSYGHRNPQGLVMVNNILYESEHGPDIEDEVNIIEKGRNYGWPDVKGPCNKTDEILFCKTHNVKEPIWSTGNSTLATSGLDYYNGNLIAQWKNSLLLMTLKNSSIQQLQLSADGKSVSSNKTWFKNEWGRLRDLCISPDGKVYVCTSNGDNNDMLIEISKL